MIRYNLNVVRQNSKKKNMYNKFYMLSVILLFLIIFLLCVNALTVSYCYKKSREEIANKMVETVSITEINAQSKYSDESLKAQIDKLNNENEKKLKELNDIKNRINKLNEDNKELMNDNIELQNTLKRAAAIGIKPQNFTKFEDFKFKGTLERGKYLGNFLGTAYTPSKDECGNNKGITNSGEPIIPGISIAIDKDYWPFGTIFYIKGLGYGMAMDTGSAIKGRNRFDFAVFDKNFASELGSKNYEVYLVKLGDGTIDATKIY